MSRSLGIITPTEEGNFSKLREADGEKSGGPQDAGRCGACSDRHGQVRTVVFGPCFLGSSVDADDS